MCKASVYRALVLATAFLCLLSFSNAEQYVPQNTKEVTHYSGSDGFVCSRNVAEDLSDIPPGEAVVAVVRLPFFISVREVLRALQQCYTLHDIRGPPAIASLF